MDLFNIHNQDNPKYPVIVSIPHRALMYLMIYVQLCYRHSFYLRYSQYIDNRYYGEEELNSWNTALFIGAKTKLQASFTKLFNEMEGKNEF